MHNSFFKSIVLTFIFVSSLFASNEEIGSLVFKSLQIKPLFYFMIVSLFILLLTLYFIENLTSKTSLFNILGSNTKKIFITFDEKVPLLCLKKIINNTNAEELLYVLIFSNNRLIYSTKLIDSKNTIYNIYNMSKDKNNEIIIFNVSKVLKKDIFCNFIFSLITSKLFKFIQFFTIRNLAVFFTIVFIFLFYIWENYFKSLINLLGLPLETLNFNITDLVELLLYRVGTQLTMFFSLPSSFLLLSIGFLIGIALLAFISLGIYKNVLKNKKIEEGTQGLLAEYLSIFLYIYIIITFLAIFLIIFTFFKIPYLTQIKIENPSNKSIELEDISLYFGDYFTYAKKLSIIEFNKSNNLIVNNDKEYIYYHDLDESKSNFFKNEIKTISYIEQKNVFKNCKEILSNISKESNLKEEKQVFISILLNREIFNNIQKKRLKELLNTKDKEVTYKSLYFDEIFYKCKILKEISLDYKKEKEKEFYFLNDMSKKDFDKWVDSFNSLNLTTIEDWAKSLPSKLGKKIISMLEKNYDYDTYMFYIDKYIKEKKYYDSLIYLQKLEEKNNNDKKVINIEIEALLLDKKAFLFSKLGKTKEAIIVYKNLVEKYSRSKNIKIKNLINSAKYKIKILSNTT